MTKYSNLIDDYKSSAKRHLNGSDTLLRENQYEESAYLAGYVSECSIKKMVQLILKNDAPIFQHDISLLSNQLIQLIQKTAEFSLSKYIPTPQGNLFEGSINNWDPVLRYKTDGTINETTAKEWYREASVHYNILQEMWKDGYS
ncbi:MAG: hypothetical protein JXA44_00905 [Methanospirillaceae archaeon]|nr:hypothetical protein [Methanospirillaceae archaeon]